MCYLPRNMKSMSAARQDIMPLLMNMATHLDE